MLRLMGRSALICEIAVGARYVVDGARTISREVPKYAKNRQEEFLVWASGTWSASGAKRLGLTPDFASSWLSRGFRALRDRLGEYDLSRSP